MKNYGTTPNYASLKKFTPNLGSRGSGIENIVAVVVVGSGLLNT